MADEHFKAQDARSYEPVVGHFDRFTERYTVPLAHRLVDLAGVRAESRWLDLATGTGVVARAVGEGRGIGGDLSMGMLVRAKSQRTEAPVTWTRLDAERLPFASQGFDAVVCLFGLLHFPDSERALVEMKRILRPGGRVVVAVGSGPSRWTPEGWFDGARRLRALAERRLGRRLEAPRFLDELVNHHLPAAAEPTESPLAQGHRSRAHIVPKLMRQAGFCDVEVAWEGHEAVIDGMEDFWDLQATFSSRARKRLAAASAEERELVREIFQAECQAVLRRGGRLIYPYAALFVAGRRPEVS